MISSISPWDELDPPETGTVMMNSKGAVVMNSETLAKIASGQIPLKVYRYNDVDRSRAGDHTILQRRPESVHLLAERRKEEK